MPQLTAALILSSSLLAVCAAGCATVEYTTGEAYDASDEFRGYEALHMPIVFRAGDGEPPLVLVLGRRRPDTAVQGGETDYYVQVYVYSRRGAWDLRDQRLQLVADGARIALAQRGTVASGTGDERGGKGIRPEDLSERRFRANYPISESDLEELCDADEIHLRVFTASKSLDRVLDEEQLDAVEAFCDEIED